MILVANSILDIKGVHVCSGRFFGGVNVDLFGTADNPHRASVIFGRNGSGKTTLASHIAEAASDINGTGCFYDKDGSSIILDSGSRVRVFSEDYVRDKVLIDEEGLEAIVMLGDQATAAKRISEIDEELIKLGDAYTKYAAIKNQAENGPNSLTKLEKTAKDCAKNGGWADRLAEIDGGRPSLTAPRWDSIRNAKINLTRKELEEDFKSSLIQCKRVDGADAIVDWRMQIADPGAYDEAGILALLAEVLDQPELTDREKRLLELTRNGEQRLVELALQVFADGGTTHCPMCQQEVSPAYGESLIESISKILSRKAEEFKERLDAARLLPLNKQAFLPSQISPDAVNAYEDAFQGANEAIDYVNSLISQRKSNLYSVIEISDLGLDAAISKFNAAVDAINADIESLNAAIRDRDSIKTRLREINDQIAYVDARDAISKYDAAATKLHEAKENLRKCREEQDRLRGEKGAQEAKVRMTEIAVTSINRFLSSVYFDAARFRLVPFGDVYRIESFGKPVAPKAISTGERNILALCYFFSEGGRGKFEGLEDSDPQYLVIDDPVSSFDMENRVGICSLLRERISHVLRANVESRVTVMTHDAATVAELEHILGDVKCDFDPSDNYGYCLLELTEGTTLQYTKTRKNQYSILLKTVYDYASSEEDLEEESYVIGNVMRRVLEGYSSFNFGMGIDALSRDPELKKRFGELGTMLSNAMYRLALNDESHMEEKVASLNPTLAFERYSYEEKRKLARYVLVILYRLDPEHVKKHLGKTGTSLKGVESSLGKWEKELSGN